MADDRTQPSDHEKLLAFARLVRRYREARGDYARHRKPEMLHDATVLGNHVDDALRDILGGEGKLWNKM